MRVIDSHTEGEPTRLVIEGGPALGEGSMAERRDRLEREFDHWRRTVVLEPRGSEILVGALLCEPQSSESAVGVVFFNNVGYLGMCGHGTIGVAASLAHLGRLALGTHQFETPVGMVQVELLSPTEVQIENVASYRHRRNVEVDVEGIGRVVGDVAWGGNWFFLVERAPQALTLANESELTAAALRVKEALVAGGITGERGEEIDHIEFFEPSSTPGVNSRNFVLCPGNAYDRSPCGTGTSAKLACLAASNKLAPGVPWVQESIIGSRFEASYQLDSKGQIIPTIRGRAYVHSEATLLQHPDDPFREGIHAGV